MTASPDRPQPQLSPDDEESSVDGLRFGGSRRWWIIGGAMVLIASAIAVWFGISATKGISWGQAGVTIVNSQRVDVTFDVIDQRDRPVRCELVAYNLAHATVGRVSVDLPPSSHTSTRYTRSVRTVSAAVTGKVDSCELR